MIVTIPSTAEHNGYGLVTLKISDKCPICKKPRGRIFGTDSFDGSRRINVDGWINDCGHIDRYSNVRDEGKKVKYKEPTPFNEFAN